MKLGGAAPAAERGAEAILYLDIADIPALVFTSSRWTGYLGAIDRHEGIINQFHGDGLLVTFNVPVENQDHEKAAVEKARDIQELLARHEFKAVGRMGTRIGVKTGLVLAGSVDASDRLNYTVHGDAKNIASRLEVFSPIGGVVVSEKIQQDLISQPEYAVKLLGEFALEGVEQKMEIYTVTTGAEELEETKLIEPGQEETFLPPDAVEDEEPMLDRKPATAEDVLGDRDEETDETEPTVHIAPPISSTGPLKKRRRKPTAVAQVPLIENYELPLVDYLQARFPKSEVRFVDTVCQPTKQRQESAEEVAFQSDVVLVVGGANSNNTAELVRTCRKYCDSVYHVQGPDDVRAEWIPETGSLGITAGTSTPDETIDAGESRVREISDALPQAHRLD